MMSNTETDDQYHLIPGILKPKQNCQLHYAHVIAVFFSLALILVVTIITTVTINNVENTLSETKTIIDDMSNIMPKIEDSYSLAQATIRVLCNDKNFTKFYPAYANEICN